MAQPLPPVYLAGEALRGFRPGLSGGPAPALPVAAMVLGVRLTRGQVTCRVPGANPDRSGALETRAMFPREAESSTALTVTAHLARDGKPRTLIRAAWISIMDRMEVAWLSASARDMSWSSVIATVTATSPAPIAIVVWKSFTAHIT